MVLYPVRQWINKKDVQYKAGSVRESFFQKINYDYKIALS